MNLRIIRCTRRMKSALWIALFAAALGAAGCGSARSDAGNSIPTVAVVKVSRQNISTTLEIASEFQPYQEIDVFAKVSGYVRKLYVNWGTHVKQGQLLGRSGSPRTANSKFSRTKPSVHRSEQDVERFREELNSAESSYTVAHLTYSRIADVQKTQPGLVAQQEVDVALGKDQEASAAVSGAKDALAGAEQALLSAKAALDKRQSPVCLYPHDRSLRRSRHLDQRVHGRPASRGHFIEQRRPGSLPSFAK